MDSHKPTAEKQDFRPLLKPALEFGPLLVFFIMNAKFGIFAATAAFMAATIVSLAASRLVLKRVPVVALVTAVFIMIFGALTIYLKDPTFIKVKATIVYMMFAAVLSAGLYFKLPVLKLALGEVMRLQEAGWRILTLRWIGFFVFLAALNEVIWRNFSTDTWVAFKSFGVIPLTMLFTMAQISVIMEYQEEKSPAGSSGTPHS